MGKQQFTGIIIVVALVAGGLGYIMGSNGGALSGNMAPGENVFPSMPDSDTISGQVKQVDGTVITLDTPSPAGDPRDKFPQVRQITVTPATQIIKNEAKS